MVARRMMRTATGILFLALVAGCASTPDADDPVTIKLNDLDRRLERIERVISNQSLLDLSQQMQALQTEVRSLRGSLEELQFQTGKGKDQQRDLYSDLDRRVKSIEEGGRGVALEGGGTGLPVPAGSDRANYQAAFDLLKSGQYEKATAAFQQFLTAFPASPLADNAQYWLGESYYVTQNYPIALDAFQNLLAQFPDSGKAPDALLKKGYCQIEMKQIGMGEQTLQQVIDQYPGSDAAGLAQNRLRELSMDPH